MVKKAFAVIIIIVITLNFAAYSGNKETRYEAEFLMLFDTITKIVGYNASKDEFTKHAQLIYDNLKEYHQLYDIYNNYDGINNIKTINDNAGKCPVTVDKRIVDLIKFSKEAYINTSGKMNIAFGSVLKIWHNYRTEGIDDFENAMLPPLEKLSAAAVHTNINNVIIDETKSTVYLDDPLMSLDVGAVGKGYAVEQVSNIAAENGFTSGLISVGGNVRTIGKKNNGLWNIGIQNPNKESGEKTIYTVNLTDLSLVTSGIYERYYTVDGKDYHHIIDPKTLFPSEYYTAVTIACNNSGTADALSTAVFNMPLEQGRKLIESLPNTYALWVLKSGDVKYSEGFKNLLSK